MMTTLLSVLLSIAALTIRPLPQGTQLHIRLTTTVGSYASIPGSPVSAVLIAPVIVDGETVLEAGSTLTGKVKSVTRVGFGLRHETAGLDLEFSRMTPPDGETIPLSAQVAEVDNSRERVTRDGRIQGVRSTGSLCYRVSGYIRTALQWEIHAELAEWAIRSLLMEMPEPEIYYPAGVELTLTLTEPLSLDAPRRSEEASEQAAELASGPESTRPLSNDEREELVRIAALMPYRTEVPVSGRSSDLTNILFIGSHDQIVTAFDAAGWTQPSPTSFRDRIHWIRAVAELRGDEAAPMSLLLLNGAQPDMSWQKGLNDVSKRHHIRMWKAAGTWRGREIWVGAATRDVDFAYLRPGRKLSHKIEEDVDQERDKVAYDVAFSSCGNILDWANRPDFPRFARNATGDPIVTDGRMVALELNDCPSPRLSTETVDATPLAEHGGLVQRFVRREILSARNGLLRTNPYWRTFEASRWIVESIRRRNREQQTPDPELLSKSHAAAVAMRQ
jgi:LssY C-terminus